LLVDELLHGGDVINSDLELPESIVLSSCSWPMGLRSQAMSSVALPQSRHCRTAFPCASDDPSNAFGRFPHRIISEMRVSLRCPRLSVSEEPADDRQAEATTCADRCEAMAKIVEPRIGEPGGQLHFPSLGLRPALTDRRRPAQALL